MVVAGPGGVWGAVSAGEHSVGGFVVMQKAALFHRSVAQGLLLVALSTPLLAAEQKAKVPGKDGWKSLFDGKKLEQWEVIKKFDFKRHGKVHVKDGCIVLEAGQPATGIRWTGKFPKMDYEAAMEARRVEGSDFFCSMTFPVGKGPKDPQPGLTLILGGWGGWAVGLSCIDGFYAIDTETCQSFEFKKGQWYRVRVRVTKPRVDVWIDDKHIIELETENRKLSASWEMEPCQPFGFANWDGTTGEVRNIRYRLLKKGADAGKGAEP
jgi:hypothetical protein